MDRYSTVEGHPELLRDMKTNAIIPKENNDYMEFIQKRREMSDIKNRLNSLETTFERIEMYLKMLLNERNNE